MSDLKTRLRDDLNSARKERDKQRTQLLTMTLAELRNKEIELGREAEDADVLDVVTKAVKRRKEAAEQIRAAGRNEMADNEDAEAKILGVYLPQQLTEAEVRQIAKEAIAGGANNVGAVMSAMMPHLKGRFDGKEATRIAREELG
jgi:uncharacterized protein YqeY